MKQYLVMIFGLLLFTTANASQSGTTGTNCKNTSRVGMFAQTNPTRTAATRASDGGHGNVERGQTQSPRRAN